MNHTPMEPETYKKLGRGGAGNFYSKQDIEAVTKHIKLSEHLEAAQHSQSTNLSSTITSASEYAKSGRGGAGNFVLRDDNAADGGPALTIGETTTAGPKIGYSGRGGAGNINARDVRAQEEEIQRAKERERVQQHEEVVRDVELGLRVPERVYLSGTGGERGASR